MRTIQLMERPIFLPYACAYCGVGGGHRDWFIDLGIDNELATDLRDQGAIYLCNVCVFNLFTDVNILATKWQEEHGDNGRSIVEPDSSINKFEPPSDESVGTEQLSSDTPEQTVSVPESDDDELGNGTELNF